MESTHLNSLSLFLINPIFTCKNSWISNKNFKNEKICTETSETASMQWFATSFTLTLSQLQTLHKNAGYAESMRKKIPLYKIYQWDFLHKHSSLNQVKLINNIQKFKI